MALSAGSRLGPYEEGVIGATRRTELLMDPEEFRLLKEEARRRKTSVAELIRLAVRDAYLAPRPDRGPIVDAILTMRLPRIEWKRIVKEIEAGHAGLP